jgi:hypothetical protein
MLWRGSKHKEVEEASADQTSLGNILIRRGFVTPEQVKAAIERQLMAAPPLGEILIEMGAIDRDQLEEALYEQRRSRGETTGQEEVQHQLSRQAHHMREVSASLGEIAGISNAIAAKLKVK